MLQKSNKSYLMSNIDNISVYLQSRLLKTRLAQGVVLGEIFLPVVDKTGLRWRGLGGKWW